MNFVVYPSTGNGDPRAQRAMCAVRQGSPALTRSAHVAANLATVATFSTIASTFPRKTAPLKFARLFAQTPTMPEFANSRRAATSDNMRFARPRR